MQPSAQLQTHDQHDACTSECLSTELSSYGSEGQGKQRDVRERNLEICCTNTFSPLFAMGGIWQQVVT